MINKMSELEAMTEGDNIDIIALTETLPKSYIANIANQKTSILT